MWFINLGYEKLFNFLSANHPQLAVIAQNSMDIPVGETLKNLMDIAKNASDDDKAMLEQIKKIIIKNKYEISDTEKILDLCNEYLCYQYESQEVTINGTQTYVFQEQKGDEKFFTVDFTDFKRNNAYIPIVPAYKEHDGTTDFWTMVPF